MAQGTAAIGRGSGGHGSGGNGSGRRGLWRFAAVPVLVGVVVASGTGVASAETKKELEGRGYSCGKVNVEVDLCDKKTPDGDKSVYWCPRAGGECEHMHGPERKWTPPKPHAPGYTTLPPKKSQAERVARVAGR